MTGNGGMENGSAWPGQRFGSLDVLADVPHELSAQIGDGGEDATGDDVALDPGEPQFDLVEPGRVSRREVQPDTIWRALCRTFIYPIPWRHFTSSYALHRFALRAIKAPMSAW
jgi:hypothetical protein